MNRALSLAFLSCLGASPEDAVVAAARAGYDHIGFRLLPAFPGGLAFPLADDPVRTAALKALMDDHGVSAFDVEMIRITPDFSPEAFVPFFDCAARLGGRHVLVVADDPVEARLTDSFARLCRIAAPFGLSMEIEFMPQSELRDLGAALRVLAAADQPNQGVIVDALHVSRSGTSIEAIRAIPRRWLHFVQICDGPSEIPETREALNHAARHARLMPGDGTIDLVGLFAALPADLPVIVEVPNDRQSAGLSIAEWAERGRLATLAVLAAADAARTKA